MRLGPIVFACIVGAVAWSAEAQTDAEQALEHFQAELVRQCPEKQLELLSARDLRDGLETYTDGLSQEMRQRLQKSEADNCSTMDAGAACVNLADITAADEDGRIEELAASICGSFLRCRDQGVCDYAR